METVSHLFSNKYYCKQVHDHLQMNNCYFLLFLAILIYRAFRYSSKKSLKVTHACIHGGAFIFTAYALLAAFDSHNYNVPPIANLYSLHSWIGILAVILFAFQVITCSHVLKQ